MPRGYDHPLYILPFDHRSSLQGKMFGWATVPGYVGFAIGRTVFWDPLVAWRSQQMRRDQAVAEIALRYRQYADLFGRKHATLSAA